MEQKLLTIEEAAKILGLTYGTLRHYIHYGVIKAVKVGKRRMIHPDEVARYEMKRKGQLG